MNEVQVICLSYSQAWKKCKFYPILFIPQNVNFILDTLTSIAFAPNFIPKSAVLSDPRSRDLHFFQACSTRTRCSIDQATVAEVETYLLLDRYYIGASELIINKTPLPFHRSYKN